MKYLSLANDQLLPGITHLCFSFTSFTLTDELRTPLTAVLGLASVLADASDLTSVQRELIAQIIASGMDLQVRLQTPFCSSSLPCGADG